jgi:hypothetical protein
MSESTRARAQNAYPAPKRVPATLSPRPEVEGAGSRSLLDAGPSRTVPHLCASYAQTSASPAAERQHSESLGRKSQVVREREASRSATAQSNLCLLRASAAESKDVYRCAIYHCSPFLLPRGAWSVLFGFPTRFADDRPSGVPQNSGPAREPVSLSVVFRPDRQSSPPGSPPDGMAGESR